MLLVFLIHFHRLHVLFCLSYFFLLRIINLVSKFVIKVFVIKFACANLVAKTSAVNLLISGVVIYLYDYDQLLYFQFYYNFNYNLLFMI